MRTLAPALAALGVSLLTATPAAAQDFRVTVTPYFWGPGLEGTIAPVAGIPAVEASVGFSDIIDGLQFAFASAFELRRGQWALVGDLSYGDSGSSVGFSLPFTEFEAAGLDNKSLAGTFAASYRVAEGSNGSSLDLLAGARINWTDNDVRLMRADGSQVKANDDAFWVDPVIGARLVGQLSPRWAVTGYGDVGGLGVSSDLTWQAVATINYRFTERVAVSAGYRHYAIDYDHDGFVFDVVQSGPLMGVAITF